MKLVKPKKFLGQHFLKDLKVAQDIADTVDPFPELPILEVGPGMGVLTQFLVKKERPVKVVEVDYESVAYLREAYPSLEDHIIEDDFLKMNLHRLFDGKPFVLTGNYPYNISSQIFFKMLDNKDIIPCCTGMIQKEVAERIAAGPGSKTYGILSVLIQAWYKVEYLFTVSSDEEMVVFFRKTFRVTNESIRGIIRYNDNGVMRDVPRNAFVSFERVSNGTRIGSMTITADGEYELRLRKEYAFNWYTDPIGVYYRDGEGNTWHADVTSLADLFDDTAIEMRLEEGN